MIGSAVAAPLLGGRALAEHTSAEPPRVHELFSEAVVIDGAISPDGETVAMLRYAGEEADRTTQVHLHPFDDLDHPRILQVPALTSLVEWVNDDTLALIISGYALQVGPVVAGLGPDLAFINRDGTELRRAAEALLARGLEFGGIVDLWPEDPKRIMVMARAGGAMCLHSLDVDSLATVLVDRGLAGTIGWKVQNGQPVMRMDSSRSGRVIKLMARSAGGTGWSLVRSVHRSGFASLDFEPMGAAQEPGILYVAARAEGENFKALHRFDLRTQAWAGTVSRLTDRDVDGLFSDKNGRFIGATYTDDRVVYDFADPSMAGHMESLNRHFGQEANVRIYDLSADAQRLLLHVEGPREPGTWVVSDRRRRAMGFLGDQRPWLTRERLAPALSLDVGTRDGATIRAYLTAPRTGPGRRPLIVMPHGGPEVRDSLRFDPVAQAFAAEGWLVLQPNFRGSGGYGRAFAEAGMRQWNGRVMEDIEDAVAQVIRSNIVDEQRVAIVGQSFGGYAALMQGVRNPGLYRAIVATAGDADLARTLRFARGEGGDSIIHQYWVRQIGDARADAAAIAKASPARRAAEIRAPVLLVHGLEDDVVEPEQSRIMARALKRAGKAHELVEYRGVGHSDWDDETWRAYMTTAIAFVKAGFDGAG